MHHVPAGRVLRTTQYQLLPATTSYYQLAGTSYLPNVQEVPTPLVIEFKLLIVFRLSAASDYLLLLEDIITVWPGTTGSPQRTFVNRFITLVIDCELGSSHHLYTQAQKESCWQ